MYPAPGQRPVQGGYGPPPTRPVPRRSKGRLVGSIVCMILGVVLVVAGVVLTRIHIDGLTISQINGVCTSGIGQFAQSIDVSAHQHCGQASLADHAIGWLLGVGVAVSAAGVVLLATGSRRASSY